MHQAQKPLDILGNLNNQDPMITLRWENILDDVNNAHDRLDSHLEQTDEWLHDFDARMGSHAVIASRMYDTICELQQTVKELRAQIDLLKR